MGLDRQSIGHVSSRMKRYSLHLRVNRWPCSSENSIALEACRSLLILHSDGDKKKELILLMPVEMSREWCTFYAVAHRVCKNPVLDFCRSIRQCPVVLHLEIDHLPPVLQLWTRSSSHECAFSHDRGRREMIRMLRLPRRNSRGFSTNVRGWCAFRSTHSTRTPTDGKCRFFFHDEMRGMTSVLSNLLPSLRTDLSWIQLFVMKIERLTSGHSMERRDRQLHSHRGEKCTPRMEDRMAVLYTFVAIQHFASWQSARPPCPWSIRGIAVRKSAGDCVCFSCSGPLDSREASPCWSTRSLRTLTEFLVPHLAVLGVHGAPSSTPDGPSDLWPGQILPSHLKDLWTSVMPSLQRSIPSPIPENGPGNPSAVLQRTLLSSVGSSSQSFCGVLVL